LNFPLVGDFSNSSIIFVDDFNEPLEEYDGEEVYLINTRQLHGVKNKTDKDRITLTIGFDRPFETIKRTLDITVKKLYNTTY
jgi:aspartyl/asparaginyl beta-hydroxylase (cupin superfamily)